ncbi:hypothetical protein Tco_1175080 [Tanacetum coccineum]
MANLTCQIQGMSMFQRVNLGISTMVKGQVIGEVHKEGGVSDDHKVIVSMHLYDKALEWHKQCIKYHGENVSWLVYGKEIVVLEGYSHASWINHVEDSSSTSGWMFLLRGGTISWASRKQTCITSSTMKSEFVTLDVAGKEAKWLKNLKYEILI